MRRKIKVSTFDAEVTFLWDVGIGQLRSNLRKMGVDDQGERDDVEGDYSGLTLDLGRLTWLVYVPDTGAGDQVWLLRTLSHEANHVALQMMRKLGVEDDETVCYVQDQILGEMWRLVRRGKPGG